MRVFHGDGDQPQLWAEYADWIISRLQFYIPKHALIEGTENSKLLDYAQS